MTELKLTDLEKDTLEFILNYFYEADLNNMEKKYIVAAENIMKKLGMEIEESKEDEGI